MYITGCDSGFGNNLAKHLDKLGFPVIAGCYTEKGEDELKKISSKRLTTVPLDVSNSESVKKAADFIKNQVGDKGEFLVQHKQSHYVVVFTFFFLIDTIGKK